jgi:L-fucose isomerase-like protein
MIPAFLPFGEDSEGGKAMVPVACEGDLKGAMTSAILAAINPGVPPLFGDVIVHTDEHITISNCGSSSVYWAGRSHDAGQTLSRVRIMPQLHGASGGAVRYLSAPGPVTVARLFRLKGRYYMYMGAGRIEHTEYTSSTHGTHWPQTLVTFDTDHADIFDTIPCQHMVLTGGDVTEELIHYCRYLGIRPVRCDDPSSLNEFRNRIAYDI